MEYSEFHLLSFLGKNIDTDSNYAFSAISL